MGITARTSLQHGALVLVAALLLQGCKPDTTPDPFAFAGQSRVSPDTLIESEAVTITGINIPAKLSITGGEYSIEGKPYRDGPGAIQPNQKVRIRVRSSSESSGVVSATLTIGDVSATFTAKTLNFTGRVEAEDASPLGGATTVADSTASKGNVVSVGSAGLGISIADSLDAKALILAYRADKAGTLETKVNGTSAGTFFLRPTEGAYATSSIVVTVHAGDVIDIANPTAAESSQTFVDYLQFAESPFRSVSTVAATEPWSSDGLSIGPDGNLYLSQFGKILRITPAGEVSTFAIGLNSGNDSGFDSQGNLYVADYQASAVRKITPDGVMTTLAAALDGPAGLWVDVDDNVLVSLYGANFSGTGAKVLRITPGGVISVYASGGGLQDVVGLVGDDAGRVYASNYSSGTLFDITNGNVAVLAETGSGANQLCYSHGYIYVPGLADDQIRRVALGGTVEHFAGTAGRQTLDGPLASAGFLRPSACDFADDGTVMYLLDWESGLIRRIDAGNP